MRCPSCDFENAAGKKFCIRCGVAFGVRCPKCGSENPPEASFCGDCGARAIPAYESAVGGHALTSLSNSTRSKVSGGI